MDSSKGARSTSSWTASSTSSHSSRSTPFNPVPGERAGGSSGKDPEPATADEELRDELPGPSRGDYGNRSPAGPAFPDLGQGLSEDQGRSRLHGGGNVSGVDFFTPERLVEWGINLPDASVYWRMDLARQVRELIRNFRDFLKETEKRSGGFEAVPDARERRDFLQSHPHYAHRFLRIQEFLRGDLPQTFGARRGRLAEVVEGFVFGVDNILNIRRTHGPERHGNSGGSQLPARGMYSTVFPVDLF